MRPGLNRASPTRLTLHADQLVEHLVGGRDDLGIRRIGALGDDHLGELLGQVDGRGFQGRLG